MRSFICAVMASFISSLLIVLKVVPVIDVCNFIVCVVLPDGQSAAYEMNGAPFHQVT